MDFDAGPSIAQNEIDRLRVRGMGPARRIRQVPHWLIAIFLLLPVFVIAYSGVRGRYFLSSYTAFNHSVSFLYAVTLFIPGAVRRLRWEHLLVMACLAAVAFGFDQLMTGPWLHLPFEYGRLFATAVPILLVASGEWVLSRPRSPRAIGWLLALSVSVACVVVVTYSALDFTGSITIPQVGAGHLRVAPGNLIYRPMLAVLTWIAIPAALGLGRHVAEEDAAASRLAPRRAKICVAVVVVSVSVFLLFFHVLLGPLAERSLARGHGPFSRRNAVCILMTRPGTHEQTLLWQALEETDWSAPRLPSDSQVDEELCPLLVNCVAALDEAGAARRLSGMVLRRPSHELTGACAMLFARQQRRETVPLLLRYALSGSSGCTQALVAMRVPCAALAILREASLYDRPAPLAADFPIRRGHRDELIQVLGFDAGPRLSDWSTLYDRRIAQLPSGLSEQETAEVARVSQVIARYWKAEGRLYEGQSALFVRRMEKAGNASFIASAVALAPVLRGERADTQADEAKLAGSGFWEAEAELRKVRIEMSVAPPDWNALDTAQLEREVESYVQRVRATLAKYAAPMSLSLPSSRPADSNGVQQ